MSRTACVCAHNSPHLHADIYPAMLCLAFACTRIAGRNQLSPELTQNFWLVLG
jgi:hypothetical protein